MPERAITKNGSQMRRTEDVLEVSEEKLIRRREKLVEFLLRVEQKTSLKEKAHIAQVGAFTFLHADKIGR